MTKAAAPLAFVVPGRLDQITGGYLFDRRIVEGLRAGGRVVDVIELAGTYPDGDGAARRAMTDALAGLPDEALVVVDGLALPGLDRDPDPTRRLRTIGFVHHPLALETGIGRAEADRLASIERAILPALRGVVCPSRRTAEAVAAYGVETKRIAVTPPGTTRYARVASNGPGATLSPSGPRAPGGPCRLLCVATLTPRKGHVLLVEALAGLADLDWHLTCVGSLVRDPETTQAVCRAIAQHGLGERIELVGEYPPDRLAEAYGAADLFVLPSYHEGYGMAFAEAMACGLPVLGTTAGAIPDTVPAAGGLLVPPGDRDALGFALRRLIGLPSLRGLLAEGARSVARDLPDWPTATADWAAAVDRLAALPAPG